MTAASVTPAAPKRRLRDRLPVVHQLRQSVGLQRGMLVAGLVMPGESTIDSLINCSSGLLSQGQSTMEGRPFVELNGPCVQGTSRLNSAAGGGGLVGGRVNYWGGTDQTNAGTLRNQGIDVSLSYEFDNVFGGQLRPSLDGSYILDWELDGFTVADSTLARMRLLRMTASY